MNYQNLLNSKIKEIKPSGIRRFFDIVAEMDDVISLGVGEPGFPHAVPYPRRRHPIPDGWAHEIHLQCRLDGAAQGGGCLL